MKEVDDIEVGVLPSENNDTKTLTDFLNDVNIEHGLTETQVQSATEKYGINEIPVKITPLYILFLRHFTGFLPFLIEIAAIISIAVLDYVDFGIIVGKSQL